MILMDWEIRNFSYVVLLALLSVLWCRSLADVPGPSVIDAWPQRGYHEVAPSPAPPEPPARDWQLPDR